MDWMFEPNTLGIPFKGSGTLDGFGLGLGLGLPDQAMIKPNPTVDADEHHDLILTRPVVKPFTGYCAGRCTGRCTGQCTGHCTDQCIEHCIDHSIIHCVDHCVDHCTDRCTDRCGDYLVNDPVNHIKIRKPMLTIMHLMKTVKTVKMILENYKPLPFMRPDWSIQAHPDDNNINIQDEIGYYCMTRTIDNKFSNIMYYQRNINNSFQRALWHIASAINFSQHGVDYSTFMRLYDAFCLLSRPMDIGEFESRCRNMYGAIEIPYWIYHKYRDAKHPFLDNILSSPGNEILLLTDTGVEPELFFKLLCSSFDNKNISINLPRHELANVNDAIIRNKLAHPYSRDILVSGPWHYRPRSWIYRSKNPVSWIYRSRSPGSLNWCSRNPGSLNWCSRNPGSLNWCSRSPGSCHRSSQGNNSMYLLYGQSSNKNAYTDKNWRSR
jgi:hypothetical protein